MASEWRPSTWGDEISLEYGKAIRGYPSESGKFRVYGSNGPIGWHSEYLAPGPGVILGRKGAYRGIRYCCDPFWVIDTAYFAKPKTKLDMRWVYYAMNHYKLGEIDDGSPIPSTTRSAVYIQELEVPPLEEQRAIAHILGTLDDKIELNRKMNETLEAMARALFQSWFVDFDPVRAKAEGRPTGLPDSIANLFPNSFQNSELGPIPTGWTVKSLDGIAEFINGLALQKYPPSNGESLPVIKIAQLRAGNTIGADRASSNLRPDYIVQDGDVLFSWSGSLVCELWAGGDGALNQHLFKVLSAAYPKWLCYLGVRQHLDDFRHIAAGKATTMGHIQRRHLTQAKLAIPPDDLLRRMTKVMEPIIENSWRRAVQSRALAALRDELLPKLISGEIRVRAAEKWMERTV